MAKGQLATFQFVRYSLRSFEFKVHDLDSRSAEGPRRFDVVLQRAVSDPLPIAQTDETSPSLFKVAVELDVSIDWATSPAPFELNARMRGMFSFPQDLPEEDVTRLCRYHAPALLYAQLRPIVRMHAAEAEVTGFTLPLINVTETLKQSDADTDN